MAYPALLVAPWVYGINFRAEEMRQHARPNRFRFGAAADLDADAVATLLPTYYDGQLTSQVKRIGQHNVLATHPAGSLYSSFFILKDSGGAVWRQQLRNWKAANPSDYPVALWTGVASADTNIVALGAAPALPNSGSAITVVQYTIVNRS